MKKTRFTEEQKAFADHIPWNECAQPKDIANAVVFLASDKSRYMTGEIIDVNGGLVMTNSKAQENYYAENCGFIF